MSIHKTYLLRLQQLPACLALTHLLSAAIEKAKQVIEREQAIKLSQADAMILMEALDRPAISNSKLKAASERYERKTQ